jgi:predicted metal-dependent phosphoesterase TrpH
MNGGARLLFRVDLHVHTRRYSPCAEALDPEYLGIALEKAGLDGLVITEHDQLWPADDIALLNRKLENKRIYRGVEVSSSNGHFIVIGLEGLDDIRPGISIEKLMPKIHFHDAAIIWAHPHLHYGSIPAPLKYSRMPAGLHAVEVASGVTSGKDSAATRAMARRMGWATVGGSDAHFPGQVGCAYTLLTDFPENEMHLAEAIRKGQCRARHRAKMN